MGPKPVLAGPAGPGRSTAGKLRSGPARPGFLSGRRKFWSNLKARRTREVRQEQFSAKKKRRFRLIVDDRGPVLVLHTCDLNLKRIAE